MSDLKQFIQKIVDGHDLSVDESSQAMALIMEGVATPAQFGAFVTALRIKGESPEEIAGMAGVMREKSLRVGYKGLLVDTCGTGGSGKNNFNISTAAAFVAAGAGIVVAKHGNRTASRPSGSADVLEQLGVNINLKPDGVQRCLEEVGIGFMFAQTFHPSMKFAGPLRPEIGIRTIFNILGPITNPAGATRQVIGVAIPDFGLKIAQALSILGTEHALIVHGKDGSDEISVSGHTDVWSVHDMKIKKSRTRPADFGLPDGDPQHLVIDTVEASAKRLHGVLANLGSGHNAPPSIERSARTAVIINAAAALVAGGKAKSYHEGASLAAESIGNGEAAEKLRHLVDLSQTLK